MINLETPKKFRPLIGQAHQVAMNLLRPNSRKLRPREHEYPKELDMLAAMVDGLSESGQASGAGASGVRQSADRSGQRREGRPATKNGSNLASVLSIMEMCWGDVGLLLSMPRQGLGNSAIASVANDEQAERFKGVWAGDGDHRAGRRLGLREHPHHRRARRRRLRHQRREDLRHRGRPLRRRRGLGDPRQVPRPRRDQVLRGPQGHARA